MPGRSLPRPPRRRTTGCSRRWGPEAEYSAIGAGHLRQTREPDVRGNEQNREPIAVTTALIAVGAALGTLVAVLAVLWTVRRSKGSSDAKLMEVVADMNARMEGMVRELSEALERAQEEGRRNRFLGELAGSIDLDEVLTRTLEAAGAIPGADAALVTIFGGAEKPIVATLGLSADEAQHQAISGPPDGHHQARAVSIAYQ